MVLVERTLNENVISVRIGLPYVHNMEVLHDVEDAIGQQCVRTWHFIGLLFRWLLRRVTARHVALLTLHSFGRVTG